jgi:hypothetical protein
MQMRERGREENVLIRPPLECILQIMSFEYIFHKSKTSNAKRKTLVFLMSSQKLLWLLKQGNRRAKLIGGRMGQIYGPNMLGTRVLIGLLPIQPVIISKNAK